MRIALVLLALSLVACGGPSRPGRVLILGFDGMDPRAVDLLMAEGKLPHFARLRQEGAYGRLLSEKPLLSPIVWTTIATGRRPTDHGISHFTAVEPATGKELPVTSRQRRVKALWNLASEHERKVAVVGWWATWPPETVRGQLVSDHTAYHFLFQQGLSGTAAPAEVKTYPAELLGSLQPMLRRPDSIGAEDLAPFARVSAEELARPFEFENDLSHLRWALATAESYRDIGLSLWKAERPDLAMVYFEGTDSTAHLFGHLFRAEGLAGELAAQQARYGGTVEAVYELADRILGDYLAALDDETTLVVLSDHGFDLGRLHDDPSELKDLRRVSERYHHPEGILYLFGRAVKRHARLEQPRIYDVTPTVLALLGLPAAGDMPGRVLDEGLDELVVPARIASYETGTPGDSGTPPAASPEQTAMMEHLRSLGYVSGPSASPAERSTQATRNEAAMLFEAGRYPEAAALYRQLLTAEPNDAALHTSFAGVLGALGRYDDAAEYLDRAIALDPLNVEAYHNRGVLAERRAQREAAIASYREALRYNPAYEPSRQALARLTGSAETQTPGSPAEAQALELANQAAEAAKRGNYPRANRLLDEATQLAPELALLYQYRSNVAYLSGDLAAAVRALEKALELEPDNALYKENLRRLRER